MLNLFFLPRIKLKVWNNLKKSNFKPILMIGITVLSKLSKKTGLSLKRTKWQLKMAIFSQCIEFQEKRVLQSYFYNMDLKAVPSNGWLTHQKQLRHSFFLELALTFGWETTEETFILMNTSNTQPNKKSFGILILSKWVLLTSQHKLITFFQQLVWTNWVPILAIRKELLKCLLVLHLNQIILSRSLIFTLLLLQ